MTETADPPLATPPDPGWRLALPAFAATFAAYVAAGLAGLVLAIAPAGTSPLCPAAGIALASVLVRGWRMLLAVALGSFCVGLAALSRHGAPAHHAAMAAAGAAGAVLQAGLGAALIRRYVRQPLVLTLPGDVARFMAACLVASLVAPTIGTAALRLSSALPACGTAWYWTTSWIGNVSGLMIVTPIVLTMFGRPASQWRPRRVPVGVTLLFVLVLLSLGALLLGRWNDDRIAESFERDAASASLILATQMEQPLRALDGLHDAFTASPQIGGAEVHRIGEHWLDGAAIQAMGWGERVRHDDLAAFEARARADGSPGYRVFDRAPLPGAAPVTPPTDADTDLGLGLRSDGDVVAVRYVEPPQLGVTALGLNAISLPTGRAAVIAAVDSGAPAVSTGFRMAPQGDGAAQPAVVLYQAVYDGDPRTRAQRRSAFRGLVFVAFSLDRQLAAMAGKVPAYLGLCVVDASPGEPPRRLGGQPGCEAGAPRLLHERALGFAGHPWRLRVSARAEAVPDADNRSAWIFSAAGLFSAALLGASLLITTGRTRRIESAVRDRTAALRAEVGERHAAEAALRASEERFRNILDHVPIGIVYAGLDGRMIQANPRFCELTGYSEAELATLSPAELTDADDLAAEQALTAELVSGRIPMYWRHRHYITKSGETVRVRATVTLLRDSEQQPSRIVAVVEDITEHLRLEEAERAREAAEAANVAKSEFLSRMSHELRTPLNAMLGFAQLLEIDKRQPLSPVQQPWVTQIQQAGWHLLEMINDVLDLSRIESGNVRLQITALDLPELVAATVALVGSEAARRNIRISEDLGPGTAGILGDPTRVKQILTNLLSNAVKYNVDGGRVHVASRLTAGDRVEISVTDTGMGMTAEQMSGLFKPFNRLGRERSALQGTGIGLVISRRLAELMGGSISVRSLPGEGSSFTLRLPKSIDADTVPSPLDALETGPAEYHRRIVHYIEDNETNVEVMRGILSQRPQVQLEVSVTGLDGLAAVRARRPHLVLLDMHLPDISGLELLRHLKSDADTASVPVLVVSADALASQIDAALAAGASRYLTKPVDVAELLGALDDLLDRMDTGFS